MLLISNISCCVRTYVRKYVRMYVVIVVVLLFYVHGKHLRSCRDGH